MDKLLPPKIMHLPHDRDVFLRMSKEIFCTLYNVDNTWSCTIFSHNTIINKNRILPNF
jgi:hypothetical protein